MKYLFAGLNDISGAELASIMLGILTLAIYNGDYYLVPIIVVFDIAGIVTHGFITKTKGFITTPWRSPAPALIRLSAIIVMLISTAIHVQASKVCMLYIVTIASICQFFRCLLLAVNKKDDSWLAGIEPGKIGIPNWISIIRIALALIAPHMYVAQPFGEELSCRIATVIVVCAMATDAVDGFIARKLNQCTKAGKALDPLGDKIIFYPVAIAFLIASKGTGYLSWPNTLIFYVSFGLMVARDLGVIIWFACQYSKLSGGIGASIVDKLRMIAMCVWLGSAALAMSFASIRDIVSIVGLVSIAVVAVLSIVSAFVDISRVKKLQS